MGLVGRGLCPVPGGVTLLHHGAGSCWGAGAAGGRGASAAAPAPVPILWDSPGQVWGAASPLPSGSARRSHAWSPRGGGREGSGWRCGGEVRDLTPPTGRAKAAGRLPACAASCLPAPVSVPALRAALPARPQQLPGSLPTPAPAGQLLHPPPPTTTTLALAGAGIPMHSSGVGAVGMVPLGPCGTALQGCAGRPRAGLLSPPGSCTRLQVFRRSSGRKLSDPACEQPGGKGCV